MTAKSEPEQGSRRRLGQHAEKDIKRRDRGVAVAAASPETKKEERRRAHRWGSKDEISEEVLAKEEN